MYISLWENSRGHPDNVSFMQFSTKIDGFEQKDSQGFENSYNSYEQYPLEKFFIFTIYQNYTLALSAKCQKGIHLLYLLCTAFMSFRLELHILCRLMQLHTTRILNVDQNLQAKDFCDASLKCIKPAPMVWIIDNYSG